MAATIAKATGYDRSRRKDTHRLGSERAAVEANTWRTFARAFVAKDGSGQIAVSRDGKTLHVFDFGPEDEPYIASWARASDAPTARERAAALLTDTDISGILAAAPDRWRED